MDSSLRLRAITLNLFLGLLITLATLDPTFCSGVSEVHCIQSERQALLKIKQDLIDPSNRLASWAVDGNCCQWVGVVCNNVTGHVQELHLQSVPPPLLEYFSIQAQYEAEIQAYARSMFGDLCLSHCNISFIPTTPSVNSSSLTTLDLSFNNFGNTLIPFWVFGHQNLVSLNLSANGFQGPIPIHLRNMTSLRHLDLSHNDFNSSIPNWLYNFSHLEFLNLRMNQLQGTISSAIGNLTSAISIDLTSNELGGKVPRSLGDVCSIKEIKFSDNKWGQDISEILGSLSRCVSNGLEILELYYTELSGHLTEELGQFQNLVQLSLEDAVPSLFWSMSSQFNHLNLSHNHIYGQIPNIPMALYISSMIDISSNLFEGPLPRISSNDLLVVDGDTVDFERASLVIKGQVREYSTNLRLSLHESSFIGNELCGPPLTDNCTINDAKPDTGKGRSKDSGGREVDWFYVSMAPRI
uniref:Leucine-rich repeat-containing N-terminal plant-type domain-containing protein n=1 Tax=Fagus sylvatica TaxID=28930 RepID=A0A2N9J8H1_FAGSY